MGKDDASHLAEKRVSFTTIAAILGHTKISTMLEYYSHTTSPELERAIEQLPNWELV